MAIHDDVDGIEVSICMKGEELQEYETETKESQNANPLIRYYEDQWTVTKYVESETDEDFSIKFTVQPYYQATSAKLGFEVLLDGVRVRESLVDSWEFKRNPLVAVLKGAISSVGDVGIGTLRKFKFSKIETGMSSLLEGLTSHLQTQNPTSQILKRSRSNGN
jgi:hypothetical protein